MLILRVVTLGSATGRFGGPFDTAMRQAQVLASNGHQVRVLYGVERGDEPRVDPPVGLEPVPVRVRSLLKRWPFSSLISVRALREIWRQVGSADVVHVSMARDLLPAAAAVAALVRRRRLVLQPHGMLTTTSGSGPLAVVIAPLLKRADRVIALTEVEAHRLTGLYGVSPDRFTILGNPVDPQAAGLERSPGAGGEALFVARLHARKRPEDFVAAARFARDVGWSDRYVLLGPDGGRLDDLRADIEAIGNLDYAGSVPASEVAARVARAGVFVLCSEDEPWGNVLVSALAMGVPCVVTASCALADQLAEAGAAVVVKDRDSRAIAAAVHEVLTSADRESALSSAGRRFVEEQLAPERQAERLLASYR